MLCWNRFFINCHLKIRVDKSSSELICVINFKPKSLSHRLHRSTPDMVSVIRAANLYMTIFRLASRVREMHILISEMHNMDLEMHNMDLDPSKMCTRRDFCPRRDAYYGFAQRIFWAICSAETVYWKPLIILSKVISYFQDFFLTTTLMKSEIVWAWSWFSLTSMNLQKVWGWSWFSLTSMNLRIRAFFSDWLSYMHWYLASPSR